MNYEMVAGVEVHVELSTRSKIFCSCTTEFGGAPNTHVCPICMGMPGTLPVLNKAVVDYAIRTGLALGCDITRYNKFDRKNYFYPDLPKAYQVSQLYLPICRDGHLTINMDSVEKSIGIHEIHMEEDAGKLIHDVGNTTLVDYNRCGVPLLEIVSEPDFRSADDVITYLEKLREILLFLGVSDCKMQEGSMRADINVSVRPIGATEFGTRTEMKNMNSFRAIHKAIQYETQRQIDVIENGGVISQETRRWDGDKDQSFSMRSKENAQDYRYFPEPDLLPIKIDDDWINSIKEAMPELPEQKRKRYQEQFGLPEHDSRVLTSSKEISDLFEKTTQLCGNPKEVSNLIMVDVTYLLSETATLPENMNISPEMLASLIDLITSKKINRNTGKDVLEQMFKNKVDPECYVKKHGLMMLNDDTLVSDTIDKVLSDNPKSVEDFHGGKDRAFGFLVGQTMKALKGKADPQAVNRVLKEKLGS